MHRQRPPGILHSPGLDLKCESTVRDSLIVVQTLYRVETFCWAVLKFAQTCTHSTFAIRAALLNAPNLGNLHRLRPIHLYGAYGEFAAWDVRIVLDSYYESVARFAGSLDNVRSFVGPNWIENRMAIGFEGRYSPGYFIGHRGLFYAFGNRAGPILLSLSFRRE